jgi:NAD(P)H-hydrate epimerase
MKILTTEQIRRADAYTITHEPVPSLDLMERAALGLARYIEKQPWNFKNIRIFAGYGNNGGDGMALARLLSDKGRYVNLYLITPEKSWSPDAKANLNRLPEEENLEINYPHQVSDFPEIEEGDLIIDAIFGTGLSSEPIGLIADLIDHINNSNAPVLSIDIPSGLFGEDNRSNSRKHIVRAFQTLTFEFPKLAFFLPENHAYVGEWKVIPIGLHPDFTRGLPTQWNFTSLEDARRWLKVRGKFSHKGSLGHSLLIAGSTGKAGAAVLAASACIRSGSGLTTVMIPGSANSIVQTAVPEAMTIPDSDPDRWTQIPDLTPFNSLGVGPGIGVDTFTWSAMDKILNSCRMPLVLDADALNLMALNPGTLLRLPNNSILTPHPGEFKRLFGDDPDDFTRILRLKDLSIFYRIVLILKGAHTAVAGPDGSVWLNTTGNPGMATGGAGDVLTGLITGLLAQGYEPVIAARLGVFIHGLAGDLAAENVGQEAMKAGDIVEHIGKAYLRIHNNPS